MNDYLRVLSIFLFILAAVGFGTAQSVINTPKTYRFTNGKWFNGKGFKNREFYSVDGLLTKKKPRSVDETVDLKGQFVIPPFADAHTHNLDRTFNTEQLINEYLAEGVFYVQVLTNYASGAKLTKPLLNKPSSIDVVFSNGGLSSTLGHPFMAYETFAAGFYNAADWDKNLETIKKSRIGENDAYWFFDSRADVDAKWEKFLASQPDLVKIFLIDSENYEKTRNSGKAGDKGLSPEVAEYIVTKARLAKLHVYAHVETVFDFRLALKIGVTGFAHLPYYGWNGKLETTPKDDLSLDDIKLAAKKGVFVTPTAQIGKNEASDFDDKFVATLNTERFTRVLERQKRLYNMMKKNGVKIILGSDYFGRTLGVELWYLHDNNIFDSLTLLKIGVEDTPKAIFPERKIGRLDEGYEASFITVADDPIINFATIRDVKTRFKQGTFISLKK